MDFIVDGGKFADLQVNIGYTATEVDNNVLLIYSAISQLHEGWDAESYDIFKENMDKFKGPLKDAALALYAFGDLLSGFSVAIKAFQDGVNDALGLKVTENQDTGISDTIIDAQFDSTRDDSVFAGGASAVEDAASRSRRPIYGPPSPFGPQMFTYDTEY